MKTLLMTHLALSVFFTVVIAKTTAQSCAGSDTTFETELLADDSNQSIPLGNGDLGVNVWVEKNGDLLFYISKSDAWSRNMETLKVGKIRVRITSMPFVPGACIQKLFAHEGRFEVLANIKNDKQLKVTLWVDAHNPQIMVEVDSDEPELITVSNELMRPEVRVIKKWESPWKASEANIAYAMQELSEKTITREKDDIVDLQGNKIAWVHYNRGSLWERNVELNWMKENKHKLFDPLTNYAFGAHVSGEGFSKISSTILKTTQAKKKSRLTVTVHRSRVENLEQWKEEIIELAKQERGSYTQRLKAHTEWWNNKFVNSYITISGDNEARKVSQCYNLQRYVSLCAGRGNYPIRYNGSLFTFDHQQTAPLGGIEGFGADYRRWGSLFLVQNNRLNYYPMLCSGDFDTMDPLFDFIKRIMPAMKLNAINYGIPEEIGAMISFDAVTLWGTACTGQVTQARTFDELYEKSWSLQYHGSALEILFLCINRYNFNPDEKFLQEMVLPLADGVLKFYDNFFPKVNGKIQIKGNSLETYASTTNPTPDIAGLRQNLTWLLKIDGIGQQRRTYYEQLLKATPEIPLRSSSEEYGLLNSTIEKYGHWVDFTRPAKVSKANEKVIAVAEKAPKAAWNQENPDLYPVFPYRLYSIDKKESHPEEYELARRTYLDRMFQMDIGWCQDPIQAAYLGLTEDAKQRVVKRFNAKLPYILFPVFWQSSYDWTPDQDNGGVAINALQSMLLQYDDKNIYLCPAWPKEWDVKFKLHGPQNIIITGEVKSGKLNYSVNPKKMEPFVTSLF